MRKLNFFQKLIGSALFSGYIPKVAGTMGSLVGLAIYLIPGFENPTIMLIGIAVLTVAGIDLGTKFEETYGKDPYQCTIDEVVGTWISLLFVPKTILFVSLSFIIWRLLDVVKPFPARQFENLKAGWGIMLDDIVAAIYTLIIMHIIIYLAM